MLRNARYRFLLLALMVAISHVALISHVAAHFSPTVEQCELCVSQAHPAAAIPAAEQTPFEPVAMLAPNIPDQRPAAACRPPAPYLQRAPPTPSA